MIIRVTGRLGEIKIEPEIAIVSVGEVIIWTIEVAATVGRPPQVRWEIYFQAQSPFDLVPECVTTERHDTERHLPQFGNGAYTATIEGGPAKTAGEYKYGVRSINSATGQFLSDDDPYIFVKASNKPTKLEYRS